MSASSEQTMEATCFCTMAPEVAQHCQENVVEHVRCALDTHSYAVQSSKLVITPRGVEYTVIDPSLLSDQDDQGLIRETQYKTLGDTTVTRVPSWLLSAIACQRCCGILVDIFARHCASAAAAYNFVVALVAKESPETLHNITQCNTLVAVDATSDAIGDLVLKSCFHNNIFLANYTVFVLTSLKKTNVSNPDVAGIRFSEIVFQRRLLERAICTANHPAVNWLLWNGADCLRPYTLTDSPRNAFLLAVEVFSFVTSQISRDPASCPLSEKDVIRTLQILLGHRRNTSARFLSETRTMLLRAFLYTWEHRHSEHAPELLRKIVLSYRLLIMAITTIGHRFASCFFNTSLFSSATSLVSDRIMVEDCLRSLQAVDQFAAEFHRHTNFWKLYRHALYYQCMLTNPSSTSDESQLDASDYVLIKRLFVSIGSRLLQSIHLLDISMLSVDTYREMVYGFLSGLADNSVRSRISSSEVLVRLIDIVDKLESPVTHEV